MYEMKLKNFDRFQEQMEFLTRNFPHEVESILDDTGKSLLKMSQQRTPVETNHIKKSWRKSEVVRENGVFKIRVWNEEHVAMHLELGHKIVKNGIVVGRVRGVHMFAVPKRKINKQIPRRLRKIFNRLADGI
ncbi:HK97 gp10 family phage protein [Bacillus sp. RG28]|uniref:HK97 gp10 family phage protein n=1 Tax=Gottfriedia endophytica TaxID=2820819 RepID=A0A940SKR6_9BACI|nr:HK97 gp10 family phage protein [Gottfriedia endophytica]MBP0725538.1 HK97 gp10 family phage protein [Gottfriedia endophytica]